MTPRSSSATLRVGCFFVVSAPSWLKATDVIARYPIIRGVAACLLLVLLSACDPAATPTLPPTPTTSLGVSNGSITLLLWHGWGGAERQALSRLVDRFNERHPNSRVLLQSMPLATLAGDLRAAVAAGSGPHMVLIPNSWVGALADAGALRPLDDLLAQPEQDTLLPVTLSGARSPDHDGVPHLYGLPISFDTLALYYNTANILDPPDDTAKLLDAAHGLSNPSAPLWGLALNLSLDNTIGYMYAFGGRVFDDGGKLALGGAGRAGTEKWLNWLLQLNSDSQLHARVGSSIAVDREIKNGTVLMTFDWAHQMAVYRSLWGVHLGVAPLPRLSETGQPPRPYIKSDLLTINPHAGTAERAAAAEFLRFMISEDAQLELLKSDIQPARRDLKLDGGDPQLVAARAFRSQAEQGLPMPNGPTRGIVENELRIMLERVLMNQAIPSDAVTEADGRMREKLKLQKP
jgi:arabinogalactan oligomer/maltooligosaccharide transport system substrate-binding protein